MPQLRPITLLAATLAVGAFVLGVVGFAQGQPGLTESSVAYQSLQLFGLSFPDGDIAVSPVLEVARFLAPLSIVLGFMTTVLHLSRDLLHSVLLRFARGHVIVTGINPYVRHLVSDLMARRKRVVIITAEADHHLLAACREEGALVLSGGLADPGVLRKARIDTAADFIALAEDESLNVETAVNLLTLLSVGVGSRAGEPAAVARRASCGYLSCHILLNDVGLRAVLKEHDIFTRENDTVMVNLFSPYEIAARAALAAHPLEIAADGSRCASPGLILLGFGEGAPGFLAQALRIGVYDEHTPLPVHVFATDAAPSHSRYLDDDNPAFSVEGHAVAGGTTANLLEALVDSGLLATPGGTIACFGGCDTLNFELAMGLVALVGDRKTKVLVHFSESFGAAHIVEDYDAAIFPFGLVRELCTYDELTQRHSESLARHVHAGYQDTGKRTGDSLAERRVWAQLPEVKRDQSIGQADHLPVKIRLLGLDPANCSAGDIEQKLAEPGAVDRMARLEHERWNRTHFLAGYTYGEKKDDALKRSPYLVPYDELEPDIQQYDIDFVKSMPQLFTLARSLDRS